MSIVVTPTDSGSAVTFTAPTNAPTAGNRQYQGHLSIGARPYSKHILRRLYDESTVLIFGEDEEGMSFNGMWYEASRIAALAAARSDCLNFGKQRCNVSVDGTINFTNADFAGAAGVNYQAFQVGSVWCCQFTMSFRTIP